MDVDGYVSALRREGPLLAAAAERAGSSAAVPSCPGWSVDQLVRHVGGVHRWAAEHVRTGRADIVELADPVTAAAAGARARARADLFTWRAVAARLLAALGLEPPDGSRPPLLPLRVDDPEEHRA